MKKTFEIRVREYDKEICHPSIRVFNVTIEMHKMACKYAPRCVCGNFYTDEKLTAPIEEAVMKASFLYGPKNIRVNTEPK